MKKSIQEAIDRLESVNSSYDCNNYYRRYDLDCIEILLSDYKRVLKENEHKTEKIENQKSELAILNDKQKDFNKLQNTLKSYKGQFRRQEKENEKLKNQEATARKINELLVQRYSNSISVQKVKDKIIHYQELQDNYIKKYDEINEGLQAMINVLQELIEEREEK